VRAVVAELLTALALILLAAIAGWFIDRERGAGFLAFCTLGFFFLRQLWMVVRLVHWAGRPLGTPTPSASGAWSAVFDALHKRARLSNARARTGDPGAGALSAAPPKPCPTAC
jgi:hypothetical protein